MIFDSDRTCVGPGTRPLTFDVKVEGIQGRAQIDEYGIVVTAGSPLVATHTVSWPDMKLNWISRLLTKQNALIKIVLLGGGKPTVSLDVLTDGTLDVLTGRIINVDTDPRKREQYFLYRIHQLRKLNVASWLGVKTSTVVPRGIVVELDLCAKLLRGVS